MKTCLRTCAIFLVRIYQTAISPLFPPSCRYLPTCSEYAAQAIEQHGVFAGGWLTMRRLVRCHPFCAGGFDPVPGAGRCGKSCDT
jgi:hypothetical protein